MSGTFVAAARCAAVSMWTSAATAQASTTAFELMMSLRFRSPLEGRGSRHARLAFLAVGQDDFEEQPSGLTAQERRDDGLDLITGFDHRRFPAEARHHVDAGALDGEV